MGREEMIQALLADPALLGDVLQRMVRATVQDMVKRSALKSAGDEATAAQAKQAPAELVDNYWLSYAHAVAITGLSTNTLYVWVNRGHVNGGEGYVAADSLQEHMARSSANGRHMVEHERLAAWLKKERNKEEEMRVP